MGGETQVLAELFKFFYRLLADPTFNITPIVDRILYFAIVIILIRWMWKKVSK